MFFNDSSRIKNDLPAEILKMFIPSENWNGFKKNYIYKMADEGLGYYYNKDFIHSPFFDKKIKNYTFKVGDKGIGYYKLQKGGEYGEIFNKKTFIPSEWKGRNEFYKFRTGSRGEGYYLDYFIPSEKFIGAKNKYVFTMGILGLGYYLDIKFFIPYNEDSQKKKEDGLIPGYNLKNGFKGKGYYLDVSEINSLNKKKKNTPVQKKKNEKNQILSDLLNKNRYKIIELKKELNSLQKKIHIKKLEFPIYRDPYNLDPLKESNWPESLAIKKKEFEQKQGKKVVIDEQNNRALQEAILKNQQLEEELAKKEKESSNIYKKTLEKTKKLEEEIEANKILSGNLSINVVEPPNFSDPRESSELSRAERAELDGSLKILNLLKIKQIYIMIIFQSLFLSDIKIMDFQIPPVIHLILMK